MPATLPIKRIKIAERHRKDLGDLQSLADSIAAVGLLHPIVVRPDKTLIAGCRRLAALELLGWKDVPVYTVKGLDDALPMLRAERDENACRKELSPLEMVALGKALEELVKPEAKRRQQEHGKTAPGRKKNTPGNFPEVNGRARQQVAEAVGVSDRTYEKARAVADAAEAEPETYADLATQMDQTGNVDRAYKAMNRRKAPPKPKPEAPRYPHSARIDAWLDMVSHEMLYIGTSIEGGGLGGLASLLQERGKWDWKRVKNHLLPRIEDIKETLTQFEKELADACE